METRSETKKPSRYIMPYRSETMLRDEATIGCLHHGPITARALAKFLNRPVTEVISRLQSLQERNLARRNLEGLWEPVTN